MLHLVGIQYFFMILLMIVTIKETFLLKLKVLSNNKSIGWTNSYPPKTLKHQLFVHLLPVPLMVSYMILAKISSKSLKCIQIP